MSIQVAYAVVPTAVRGAVEQEGLTPRTEQGEDELTLFDTLVRATRFAELTAEMYIDAPEGRADVWEVQVGELPVTLEPNEDGPTAYVKGSVSSVALRLVSTVV